MGRSSATQRRIKRTTVDLDLDELDHAREALGTRTTRDTVNTALREVNRRAALSRAAALIEQGGLDIVEPSELRALRGTRIER
jgi:Arc/MetJ family transcription regulator